MDDLVDDEWSYSVAVERLHASASLLLSAANTWMDTPREYITAEEVAAITRAAHLTEAAIDALDRRHRA